MTEYTFTSSSSLSEYRTNVQKTALYKVFIMIQELPETVVFTENGSYTTNAINREKTLAAIKNLIKEIENKHAELVEAIKNNE